MLSDFIPFFIQLGIAIGLSFTLLKAAALIGPKRANVIKQGTYESGMDPIGSAHQRYSVKFYLVAMIFIVFDVEIVFLYPWAVLFRQLGFAGFVEMLVFVFILMTGFVYAWKKGALKWN